MRCVEIRLSVVSLLVVPILISVSCWTLHNYNWHHKFYRHLKNCLTRQSPVHIEFFDRRGLSIGTNDGKSAVVTNQEFDTALKSIGESYYRHFTWNDANEDDYLSVKEFAKLIKAFKPIKYAQIQDLSVDPGCESDKEKCVELITDFIPLSLDSITKILDPDIGSNVHYFNGLVKWQRAYKEKGKINEKDLIETFRPPDNVTVGQAFDVISGDMGDVDFAEVINPESSNRYYPPIYEKVSERTVARLLSFFHRRAFCYTRFPPHKSTAVVRAVNNDMIDIMFRIHGEYQLNNPPNYPFWFTPSFFLGHLVLKRDFSSVLSFRMGTPEDRSLNVDMEWIQAPSSGKPRDISSQVDIGYVPKMVLKTNNSVIENDDSVTWKKVISIKKAFDVLDRSVNKFKNVTYHPFDTVFQVAQNKSRLVHCIALWGSLDDQSC